MKKFLSLMIALILVWVAIYNFKAAIALAVLIALMLFFPIALGLLLPHIEVWEARARAKRIKKIREQERIRRENIERIIREVPQEHFEK